VSLFEKYSSLVTGEFMKKGKALLIGAEDEENLAIRYLGSGLEKNGHQVRIVPCSRYGDFNRALKKVRSFHPQIVAVSMAFQSMATMFLKLIAKIKKTSPDIHVNVGGHFPSFEFVKLLEYETIDSVIRFEGEIPISMLLEAVVNGESFNHIPCLVYREEGNHQIRENTCKTEFPDPDLLPFPLRNSRAQERLGEKFATLVTSRGCFHSRCLYCCIGAFHSPKKGNKYALRSSKNVASEMGNLYHEKGVRMFQFHDDNLLLPTPEKSFKRLQSLKSALIQEKIDINQIALLIKTRPDAINQEIVSTLKELGTVGVFLGVENASESGLKALGRGSNLEEINKALELLIDNEVAVTFNLLIFHPLADLQEINKNIYFMNRNLERAFDFGRAEVVAGSPLEKLVRHKGLLRGKWPQWDYRIQNDAVEKMFRINALTFYGENSQYPDLSHHLIALSYRSQLIKRFYPGKTSRNLGKETIDIIKKSNDFTLESLLEIYQMVAESEIEEKINLLYQRMDDFYGGLRKEADELDEKMWRFQLLEKKFQKQGLDDYFQNSSTLSRIFRM
jgi:anaerobic magnesium-protoporphyrin IX monomethyl ester cyclase